MDSTMLCALIGAICTYVFVSWWKDPLRAIPTIGPSLPILSYLGAIKFTLDAQNVMQEGYEKYKVFKVAMIDRWAVVVSGAKMNEELRKIPDEQMSFMDAADDLIQTKYTIAPDVLVHPIHITAIKERLTRNLAPLFPGIVEEVEVALNDKVSVRGDEWVSVPAYSTVAHIVSRASSRVFVGLPLCRNDTYLGIACNYSNDVLKGCMVLTFFPHFMKPLVGRMLPWSRRAFHKTKPFLDPILDERLKQLDKYGDDWPEKPNDLLQWTIEEAKRSGLGQPRNLFVQAMLAANFTAIHTSTITFTHALYHLAANPEYIQPLREELESVIREDGWTKISMGRMWKLDSFLKESQRVNGVSTISVMRKALQDVTFSDGTFIPAGTFVTAAATSTHYDEENYDEPNVFKPFRFSDMRLTDSEKNKHHYVSTSSDYIGFGHGKHACPGRFFAANELKIMLASIVLNYDVKFENEGKRPNNFMLATTVLPDPNAKVMFRKRK
ncbi:cytochrome P450, partial [Laetiporus sulphureus 93-53]